MEHKPFVRIASLLCMVTLVIDVAVIGIMGAMVPGYDALKQYISELGSVLNPYAPLVNAWWMVYSIPMLAFAYALYRALGKKRYGWVPPVLLGLYFLGNGILTGIFPCDAGCTGASLSNTMHLVVSGTGIFSSSIAPLVLYAVIRRDPHWAGMKAQILIAGLLLFAGFGAMSYYEGGAMFNGWYGFSGFIQRLNTYIYYAFLFRLALHLYYGRRSAGES